MRRRVVILTIVGLLGCALASRADFKYSEQSKITGGMMAGTMKVLGAFSRQAREANQPVTTTHYLKGNRLRTDNGNDNTSQIIDLDGRRMIYIDNPKRSYSIVTFEQMKAALENMQQQMKAKQQEMQAKQQGNPQVTITPKIEVTPTDNTRSILGQTARQVKLKMEMQMQGTDTTKHQSGSATMTFTSDMWVAPGLPGYEEVQNFYKRMAQSINWVPTGGMFNMNPQMAQGMEEMKKNSAAMKGLPLVQYVSMFMGGMAAQPASQPSQTAAGQPSPSQSDTPEATTEAQPKSQTPTSPSAALSQGIGSVLGGFGRKKKKQQDQQPQDSSQGSTQPAAPPTSSTQTPPPPSNSGSFMDMTVEVTSFSSDSLPASLFDVPAGYTQVEGDAQKMLGGQKR